VCRVFTLVRLVPHEIDELCLFCDIGVYKSLPLIQLCSLLRVVLLFFSLLSAISVSCFSFLFFFRGICVFVPPPSLLRNYISSLFKKLKEKERKREQRVSG
jgi:hypothetical protein